jgi:hypothetical protein
MFDNYWTDVTMSCDGDLLFMVASGKWLLQVDVDGSGRQFPQRSLSYSV